MLQMKILLVSVTILNENVDAEEEKAVAARIEVAAAGEEEVERVSCRVFLTKNCWEFLALEFMSAFVWDKYIK